MLNYKKIALSVAIAGALSSNSYAASFEFENFTVDWDTVITAGVLFRMEERDPTISVGSSGGKGDIPLNNLPNIIDNAFIINSNDGNNNFDTGMVSQRLSILTEADFNFGNFGVFARGKIWQDRMYGQSTDLSEKAWESYNANPVFGSNGGMNSAFGEYNPGAEAYAKQGAELLDLFVYGSIQMPNDRELSFRLGRQVISWGEALLSGGGLSTGINHVDGHIRSQPGLELKELFLPSGALFVQTQLTDMISLEAYYQYEWNPIIIDPPSTYMSEFDSIGDGGNTFMFVTGKEQSILGKDLTANDGLMAGDPGYDDDLADLLQFLPTACPQQGISVAGTKYDGDLNDQQYYDLLTLRCSALIPKKVRTENASNTGQFGLSLNFFLENGGELGLYYVNYHEKIPSFILPIDSIEAFAPIVDLLVNFADPANPTTFTGINDLGSQLSTKQINALLQFLSVLPDDGTIGSITSDLVENPWKLGLPDVTQGIQDGASPGYAKLVQEALAAVAYGGADWYLRPLGFSTDTEVRSVNYRIKYFENVHLYGLTYSTVLGVANVATEITYRQDTPLLSGDVARTPKPSNLWNWHLNTLMVFEPTELFGVQLWDFASFTAEILYWNAPGKKPYDINDTTNGARLAVQNTPQGFGASAFMGLEYYNVFSGWDINVPLYVNWGIDGSQFNAGYRDGQVTFATGLAFKHLSGVTIGSGLTFFFGDTDDIFQTLTQDRDNAQLYVKYNF